MALTKVSYSMVTGAPINVLDYGADASGVADSTSAIQAAFTAAASASQEVSALEVVFPAGTYKVSSSITISAQNIYVSGIGIARIEPTVLTGASTYTIFNLTGSAGRVTIKDLTFYMFGSNCIAIGATNMWRQATIDNCYVVGGATGFDLAVSSSDKWGITINKCRFNDCDYGIRWILGGQTGQVRDCLFFNTVTQDLRVVGGNAGAEFLVEGCVFESGGVTRPTAFYFDSVDEITFIGCQAERLFYDSGATGASADYQFQLVNSTATVDGCRFWGGNWGSVAPGNSRQYGMYLDNSSVTFRNSRLYSFTEYALNGVNNSRVFCDIQSRLDYRVGGDIVVNTTNNLGANLVYDGAFEKFKAAGTGTIPFSWVLPFGGNPARLTSGLISPTSTAALQIQDGNVVRTNTFLVQDNQYLLIRFAAKILSSSALFSCVVVDAGTGSTIYIIRGGSINICGNTARQGVMSDTVQVPAGTKSVYLQFSRVSGTGSIQLEEVGVFQVFGNQTSGSVYSDNDSSFGFTGTFAPLVEYCPSNIHSNTAAPLVDTWAVNDRVSQSVPTVGQPKAWACTVAGTPGTWVSEGNL